MKRKVYYLLIIILLFSGVGLMAYPYVSFRITQNHQTYVIQQYNESLAELTTEQVKEEWERAWAYNDVLTMDTFYDPFTSGQSDMDEEYLSLLNLDRDGVMCYIEIPLINVKVPVFHGTSAKVLERGAGHLESSALPVGGDGMHSVLTGHTGLNTAKMFTDLVELAIGDEFYIHTLDQILAYRIDNIIVVNPTDVEALLPVPGKDYVTLVTCTPYGINSHRLMVRGERIVVTQKEIEQHIADTVAVTSKETLLLYVGIILLLLLILIILIIKRLKK